MKNVFSYSSYRILLKDFYEDRKKANPSFSFQVFAKQAGFSTKSYISEVIGGKKPLSKGSVFNVAKAMGLKKREAQFFEALVRFNEGKTVEEKEHYFQELKTISGKSSARMLGEDQYSYFSKWYHPVIRELVTMKGFDGDISGLSKKVNPTISKKQAIESVNLLLKLGLIKKGPAGRYKMAEASVTTGDELASFAVLQFQQENLKLAGRALNKVKKQNRDISTLTAGISEEGFQTVKKEIQLFRKQLASIFENDKGQDRVYQINFQLFPLSDLPKRSHR